MPSNLPKQIEKTVADFTSAVESRVEEWKAARDPAAFRAMELEVAAEARAVADEITARLLRAIVHDPEMQAEASATARCAHPGRYRHGGRRSVKVTLLLTAGDRERQDRRNVNAKIAPIWTGRSGNRNAEIGPI